MTAASYGGARLTAFLGAEVRNGSVDPEDVVGWRVPFTAPATPGRYLAHALVFSEDFLALDHVTIPVTVVEP